MSKRHSINKMIAAEVNIGLDISKMDYKYNWFPNFDSVYIGRSPIKTTYIHSFWTGVVMTIVTLPQLLWHVVIAPVGKSIAYSMFALAVSILTRLICGLSGRAAGLEITDEAFEAEIRRMEQEKMDAVLKGIFGTAKAEGVTVISSKEQLVELLRKKEAEAEELVEPTSTDQK